MSNIKQDLKIFLFASCKIKYLDKELSCDSWKSRKAFTLFKYLASHRGEKIQKDKLIELLWPNSKKDQLHNLHSTIYILRKTLKSFINDSTSPIKYNKGMYFFEENKDWWLDTEWFINLVKKGKVIENEKPKEALGYFRKAISLYRGDFLKNDIYEDWTMLLRQHYREVYIDIILRSSSLLINLSQNYNRAIELYQQALKIDPYRENIHYDIINCLIKSGKKIEAQKKYRKYSNMMYEEFGLPPSPELADIMDEIDLEEAITLPDKNKCVGGPFLCKKENFELILNLGIRRQERKKEPLTLIIIKITNEEENIKEEIIVNLKNALRKGDVVCVWNETQIIIHLFNANQNSLIIIKNRIKKAIASDLLLNLEFKDFIIDSLKENISLQNIIL